MYEISEYLQVIGEKVPHLFLYTFGQSFGS